MDRPETGPHGPEFIGEIPKVSELRQQGVLKTFVSCWHANHHESAAMWSLYGRETKCVAVRTTYSRLDSVLPNTIWLHPMTYIDYDTDELTAAALSISPFFHKRKSFLHENEVRAVIQDHSHKRLDESRIIQVWADEESADKVRTVQVDLNTLIEQVVISPTSESWFVDVVTETAKRFGLSGIKIAQSRLLDDPLF